MKGDNRVFLENLEWFDESGRELVRAGDAIAIATAIDCLKKGLVRLNMERNSPSGRVRPASFFIKARP